MTENKLLQIYQQLVVFAEENHITIDEMIQAIRHEDTIMVESHLQSDYLHKFLSATQLITHGYRLDRLLLNFFQIFFELMAYDIGLCILDDDVATVKYTDNRVSDALWTGLRWDLFDLRSIAEVAIWDESQCDDLSIILQPIDIQSTIIFPMIFGEEHFGTLVFCSQHKQNFTSDHSNQLMPFVNLAIGAIQNTKLVNVISQSADELATLYHATSVLFRADNLVDFASQITEVVVRTFEYADCGLLVVDKRTEEIIRVKRAGPDMAHPKHKMLIGSKGLVPKAIRNGALIYEPDVRNSPDYVTGDERSLSELVVPLKTTQGIVGVIDFQSPHTHAFSERDRRLMVAFAERVAPVLENVLLYDELKQYAVELEKNIQDRTLELFQTKEQIETILRSSPDAIVLLDAGGIIQQANLAWLSMVGRSSPEVFGQPLVLFLQEVDRLAFQEMLIRTLNDKLENDLVVSLFNSKYERQIEIEISLAPVLEGPSYGVVCNIRDITQHKEKERILREALEKSEELNNLKSNFVTMASHEFRTPLTTILSSSDIIANYYHKLHLDDIFGHLQKIIAEVHYLNNLIDDILLIGRSGETGFTSQYQEIDFVEFVRDIVERIKVSDQRRHPIQVRMGRGCQTIISDKKLLSYILNNLLSNACKYSSAGSPVLLKISVDTELHLAVADKGIGIPDNDISNLFETFHRGSNVGNIRGTGIGLSIVSQVVDKMNGRIHVQSKLNQGTTIKIDLPLLNDESLK